MPTSRLLEGSDFAPESVQVLREVYERVVSGMDITDEPSRENIAKTVLRIAAVHKELDAQGLVIEVLNVLGQRRAAR